MPQTVSVEDAVSDGFGSYFYHLSPATSVSKFRRLRQDFSLFFVLLWLKHSNWTRYICGMGESETDRGNEISKIERDLKN